MDISEVVRRSGLPASTLRFYEQKGLIASVGRRGLHRVFAAGVLEQLSPSQSHWSALACFSFVHGH